MSVIFKYGKLPEDLGFHDLEFDEVLYFLYLPVSLSGQRKYTIPKQLIPIQSLLLSVMRDLSPTEFEENNVYVTLKRMYVGGGISANRPGWHSDGFMTDDLNYIWYDCLPTVFNDSEFIVSLDHVESLKEFEEQAKPEFDRRYSCKHLLKLDERVIHRVDTSDTQMMRTFVKISVSKNRYNLKGNSRNYDLDYDWPLYERQQVRNDPSAAQLDFKP